MTLQGLIKAGFKATQTRGGRVLTPVVMGAIVGVSMWAGMAEGSPVGGPTTYCKVEGQDGGGNAYVDCDPCVSPCPTHSVFERRHNGGVSGWSQGCVACVKK